MFLHNSSPAAAAVVKRPADCKQVVSSCYLYQGSAALEENESNDDIG
jgi:hypothetical protein